MKRFLSVLFIVFLFMVACDSGSGIDSDTDVADDQEETNDLDITDDTGGKDGGDGGDGEKGSSCSVVDNGDGTKTITCEDGTEFVIVEGSGGEDKKASVFNEDKGANCEHGGVKLVICTDDGEGECLENSEKIFYLCNGEDGEAFCVPGEERYVECIETVLKKQKQRCSENIKWENIGECLFCYDGEERWVTCEDGSDKKQKQVCSNKEKWEKSGDCVNCFEGDISFSICEEDNDLWQKLICSNDEKWGKDGACIEVDWCFPGSARWEVCDTESGKFMKQVCSDHRIWIDEEFCVDGCTPGAVRFADCEAFPGKMQRQVCNSSNNWANSGACNDNCLLGSFSFAACRNDLSKGQKMKCAPDANWVDDLICYDYDSDVLCSGQFNCYNASNLVTCPLEGEVFYGQERHYVEKGYCRVKNFHVKTDAVSDNYTGLSWQRVLPEKYSGCTKGDPAGIQCTWQEALNYCSNLTLDGYSDWRLPEIDELHTIVDYGRNNPSVNPATFPDTPAREFWTATTFVGFNVRAWVVVFDTGSADRNSNKNDAPQIARCVRGTKWSFVDTSFTQETKEGKVIVKAPKTKLHWTRDVASANWQGALTYCEDLTYGGYSDWRLPSISELRTLIDYSKHWGGMFTSAASGFPGMSTGEVDHYWSSTTRINAGNSAWGVDFAVGAINPLPKTMIFKFLCVRLP